MSQTLDGEEGFRNLPAVHRLLEQIPEFEHRLARLACQQVLERLRQRLRSKDLLQAPSFEQVLSECRAKIFELSEPSLRPVLNATGVLLHTNLGRAVLARDAIEAARKVSAHYSNLELDLETGERGSRQEHTSGLLCELTGAEAALVVNNCAAATLLVLSALCRGRQAVVSRGELVEIGGGFRMPEVMAESGARLLEVGTTNQTHPADYERAISAEVGLLVKVHRSNFAVVGHVAEVDLQSLGRMARERGIPLFYDAGSASLVALHPKEPLLPDLVRAVDVLSISGDKTLGGPQSGILLGRAEIISRLRSHPLARALRVDKATVAALEATLRLYRAGREREIPLVAMSRFTVEELAQWGRQLMTMKPWRRLEIELIPVESSLGGGSNPMAGYPSMGLAVLASGVSVERLRRMFLGLEPPVVARIAHERCVLDLRTILLEDRPALGRALFELEKKLLA